MNYSALSGYFLWHWTVLQIMIAVRERNPTCIGSLIEAPKVAGCMNPAISFELMAWAAEFPELDLFFGWTITERGTR